MALIVAPAAGAESYISVADADTYFLNRGNAVWAALTTDQKEQALRRSTDYMTQTYGRRWAGYRTDYDQALDWPRYGVYVDNYYLDSATVPPAIAKACAELALRASAGDLTIDVGRLKSRVKVGPIETEYVQGGSAQTRYPAVDGMLAAYLASGSMNIPVVRA